MVMKFGGSSVASAERMIEVAQIVCSFPDQLPALVLSAMGKVGGRAGWTGEGAGRPRQAAPTLAGHRGGCKRALTLRTLLTELGARSSGGEAAATVAAGWLGVTLIAPTQCSLRRQAGCPVSTPLLCRAQTTNLLLQAGEEALATDPTHIGELAPLKCARARPGQWSCLLLRSGAPGHHPTSAAGAPPPTHVALGAAWAACRRCDVLHHEYMRVSRALRRSLCGYRAGRAAGGPAARRAIQSLHRETCDQLGVDGPERAEVEALLTQLQQLLVGISIMQVRRGGGRRAGRGGAGRGGTGCAREQAGRQGCAQGRVPFGQAFPWVHVHMPCKPHTAASVLLPWGRQGGSCLLALL